MQDIKDKNLKLNLNNLINIVQTINPVIALSDFDDWLIEILDNGFMGDVKASRELSDRTKKSRAVYIKNILFNYYKLKTSDQALTLKDITKHLETVKKVSSKFRVSLKDVLNLDGVKVNDLCFYKFKVNETDTSKLIKFVAQNKILPSKNGFYGFERLLWLSWQTKACADKCNFDFARSHKSEDKNENANNKYVNNNGKVLLDNIMTDLEGILAKWDEYMFKNEDFLASAKTYETENRSAIENFKDGVLSFYASKLRLYLDIDQNGFCW